MTDKLEALSQPVASCIVKHGELLAALEEKDQRIKELESDVRFERLRLNETEIAALIKRADSAEQREEHLKADAALMGQRIAELEQRLQPLNFQTSAEEFLAHCLKADEISGDKQQTRIKELIGWFSRYYRQAANPKWLSGHVAELCYFIIKNAQAEQ